ncbi:MAG: tRNA (N(6)-L-threonylcarbamoyladenosine(37)-C(2))-methylthiotransferase MtaB, partial [bacterium]
MNFHIHTLGCKVNQYESQAVASLLTELGHREGEAGEGCDALIVNTCAVTAEAVRKSRQTIRRLAALSPNAIVAVSGCWPQAEPEEAEAVGADVLWGSGDRAGFVAAILAAVEKREKAVSIDRPFQRRRFEELPAGSPGDRTRALLKIEDGCVNFCAYCVIPYARGRVLSLPVERAAARAAELAARGYREIVLTGIEIASYGADLPEKPGLADCVEAVAAAAPEVRIRLGSLEPSAVTEE